jgi:hypothetical protein
MEWNPRRYPAWHPLLIWDLFLAAMLSPRRLNMLLSDEFTRTDIHRTGTWVCLTLLVIPLLLLLGALDFNVYKWVQLVDLPGLRGLFFWSLWLGSAAAAAVISDRPVLFFASAMIAFFVGLVVGLLALLLCEIWLRAAYKWGSAWLGYLNIALLLSSQAAGVLMIASYVR